MNETYRTVRLRIAEGNGHDTKMMIDTTRNVKVGTDDAVELFLHGYPTLTAYLSVFPDPEPVEKLETSATYGKDEFRFYPTTTDMIPRITVRDHDDVHMLLSLMQDAVEHLKTLADPVPWANASTMLQALETIHDEIRERARSKVTDSAASHLAEFFAELGFEVTIVDLENL